MWKYPVDILWGLCGMDKIAVLIPCYNEEQTIAKVVRDVQKALPDAVVYVYDNNSTDGTDEIAKAAGAVVRYEHQQVQTGKRQCNPQNVSGDRCGMLSDDRWRRHISA